MNTSKSKVIAIDGPAGSGKSTITKLIAKKLNVLYVDTGAMFRAIAFELHQRKIDYTNMELLKKFLNSIKMSYSENPSELIAIDGVDLSTKIREHFVSELSSKISSIPSIREYLLNFQRNLVTNRLAIMEGRDIGTVVFPFAFCKIYLVASDEVRAKRRLLELETRGEKIFSMEEILKDIRDRDARDKNREIAPLKQASDAIVVDVSDFSIEEVVNKTISIIKQEAIKYKINL